MERPPPCFLERKSPLVDSFFALLSRVEELGRKETIPSLSFVTHDLEEPIITPLHLDVCFVK